MTVEWDSTEASRNLKKHGVSFVEAVSVFSDPFALTFADPFHSVGAAATGRFLVIAHTDRGDSIRIISARLMTSRERRQYERDE